ncbi:hypothetical protein VD659_17290 [Herbiconiux sp. 11R-BC]|uniref:hypothetical protein n=1 Tax=Herbiconiux sp. 11R-BC TaxID=3111637 RepID=UPI003C0C926D
MHTSTAALIGATPVAHATRARPALPAFELGATPRGHPVRLRLRAGPAGEGAADAPVLRLSGVRPVVLAFARTLLTQARALGLPEVRLSNDGSLHVAGAVVVVVGPIAPGPVTGSRPPPARLEFHDAPWALLHWPRGDRQQLIRCALTSEADLDLLSRQTKTTVITSPRH